MNESDVAIDVYHLQSTVARLAGYIDDLKAEVEELRGQLRDEQLRRRALSARYDSNEMAR